MDLTNLHWLSASDAARLIRDGVVGSAELVQACLARVRETDAQVQAWAFLDPDHALAQARAADELRLSGQPVGPLHGVPVGIKDIIATADRTTENGSVLCAGRTPSRDASVVAMLRAAGAVIMGKTVTTEFAVRAPGKTRNPHNLAHTPGGSSSGSAAAVAAGMVPIALGSQTGGSVIRPAAYCGVVGFKPSFRLLPTIGMKCFSWSLDTVGLFAAGVADAAFAAALISGRDLRIDGTEPAVPRIALVRTQSWPQASASMQDAIARAARAVEAAGAKITEIELPPIFETATQAHGTIQDHEAYQALADEIDR